MGLLALSLLLRLWCQSQANSSQHMVKALDACMQECRGPFRDAQAAWVAKRQQGVCSPQSSMLWS